MLKSRKTISTASPSSIRLVILSYKLARFFRHGILLINSCWLHLMIFFFICLEIVSRMSCSITFPWTKVSDQPVVSWLLPFGRDKLSYLKKVESDLANTSAYSLSTPGCIPSGSWNCKCPVCSIIARLGNLLPKIHFPFSSHSAWPLGLGILKDLSWW